MNEGTDFSPGDAIRARRRDLRLTQQQVTERGGPSTALQRQVESGRHKAKMQAGVRRGYEEALEWAPGAMADLLDCGVDPAHVRNPQGPERRAPAATAGGDPLLLKAVERVLEVRLGGDGVEPRLEADAWADLFRVARDARTYTSDPEPTDLGSMSFPENVTFHDPTGGDDLLD